MATNKHAMIRYQALDRCFSNRYREFYIDDLIKACNDAIYEFDGNPVGVKRRMIFNDIKFMESTQGWSAPIERCYVGKRCHYRYEDPDFSINKKALSEAELDTIDEALIMLNRFKGMDGFTWIDEFITNFEDKLGRKKSDTPVIGYEQNPFLKGIEYLSPLFNYIVNKQALAVTYTPFKSPTMTCIFHPYYLKQYNNRWFVFGINNERPDRLINFALDRIDSVEQSSVQYVENTEWNFGEYFEDVIGVSIPRDNEVKAVVLKFDKDRYRYVRTKPIHPSQKELDKDNCVIQIDVMPNWELESQILSFGCDVEVLAPDSLRERIKSIINESAKKYV